MKGKGMGLRNIVIARQRVDLGDGQAFEVRGISLFDIMSVLNDYGPQMALMFGKVMAQKAEQRGLDNATVRKVISDISGEFPDVLAAAIALASDDYTPETVSIAKQLPMMKQIEAIEAIFVLTFKSEGDVVKLIESLTKMMTAATGALNTAMLPTSQAGIGGAAVN